MKGITAIVESAAYVDDLDAAEAFYRDVLGLAVLGKEPGRHVFFRVGDRDVLLVFNPATTRQGGHVPPHGSTGQGHFALGVRAGGLGAWRARLAEYRVAIEQEVQWPHGGRSLYFRDPAGNSVEILTPGVWGLPSGW